MKTRISIALLLILALAALCAAAQADKLALSSVKDANFGNYLKTFDIDGDGSLDDTERNKVTYINCANMGIADLTGVEKFPELRTLYCSQNSLTTLFVNQNTKLNFLDCSYNQLTSLYLLNNPELEFLTCYKNKLTGTLNLTHNPKLINLSCYGNQLTSLLIGPCTKMKYLGCSDNPLNVLSVQNQPELTDLSCMGCGLSSLDLTANPKLEILMCSGNNLSQLELSWHPNLHFLWCEENPLSKLDISKCASTLNILVVNTEPDSISPLHWGVGHTNQPDLKMDANVQLITDPNAPVYVTGITLNKTKETLTRTYKKPKPTLQLKVTVTPAEATNKAMTWKSSNPKVAKVDSKGKVTALKAGTVTITCTAKGGTDVKAVCKITVKDKLVTKITLNKKSATLKVKETLKLKAKVTPADAVNGKLKWTSSKKSVATVDQNGKVTAKKAGKCVITCATEDGKKKAKCTVTVK